MTLNKTDTAALRTALSDRENYFYWMANDSIISNTEYDNKRIAFQSWKSAYQENPSNLFGTNGNDSTFQFSGIDQFPIPPAK